MITEAKPELEEKYCNKSVEELKSINNAESLFECGYRELTNGDSIEEGKTKILDAAKQGHPVALVRCLLDGIGCPKDEARAVSLLHASVEREHPTALIFLAQCFEQGVAMEKNLAEALFYYDAAFEQGRLEGKEYAQVFALIFKN